MKKLLCVLAVAVLFLVSCKKETSLEDANNLPGTVVPPVATGLLTRVVSKAGADSAWNDYTYDASNRLVMLNYNSTQSGNQVTRLYYSPAGLLTRYTVKSSDLAAAGVDSISTVIFYDQGLSRYTYGVTDIKTLGVLYRDSTIFNYDGNGRLINKTQFAKAGPSDYQVFQKKDYSYNTGSDIAVAKYYSYNVAANGWDLLSTYNYGYDEKVNPLPLGVEGLIALDDIIFPGLTLDGISSISVKNAATFQYIDSDDPANDYSLSTTFTYGSNNKPTTAVSTETPGSGTYDITYYYN